jgi:fructuronate reductase
VVAEPFFDWVIEDRFVAGRPDWSVGGARFVEHAEPFERLKLRMVNGSHSALAYLGALAGQRTVDQAIATPPLRHYLGALMRDEIEPTLPVLPGLDVPAYRSRLLQRFANPALQHRTSQIAMDGSQKVPQRWLGTVRDRLRAGRPIDRLALAIAAWLRYLDGVDETGERHAIDDPLAAALAQQLVQANGAASAETDPLAAELRRIAVLTAFAPVFGELGTVPQVVQAVAQASLVLRQRGALSAAAALVTEASVS